MLAEATGEAQVLLADQSDKKLRRALSFQDLFMISFGGVVGSGWLFAVSAADVLAGPAAVISWTIAGIFMIAIALCFAETGSALSKSGQLVRGPLYSHGGFTGYVVGAAYILGSITVPAIEAEAVIGYITSANSSFDWAINSSTGLLSAEGVLLGIGLMIGFFLLNYFGIKFLGTFNSIVTWWKLIIPTVTIIFLFTIFRASNFTVGGFTPFGWPGVFVCIPAGGIGFAYLGFRGAAQFSGEAARPQKDVPRAIILSIVAATILYVLLQVVFTGAIHWAAGGYVPGAWASLSAGPLHTGPFYNEMKEAGVALLSGFASFLLADAIISPAGTGWVFMGEASRAVYGVGADGFFPKILLRIQQRTRIPWVALTVTTVVGAIFIAPFPSWYLFAGFITDAFTISLLMGPLTLLTFRRYAPKLVPRFRLPAAWLIGAVAFIGGSLVVYWSEFGGLFYVFSVLFGTLPLFYVFYAPTRLGLRPNTSVAIGVVQLILVVIDSVYGYVYLHLSQVVSLTPSPVSVSNSALTQTFLIYFVCMVLIVWVPTILVGRYAHGAGQRMIRAGYWILALLFFEMILSWFSVLGTFPFGPLNGAPYIAFPWDTVMMVVAAAVLYVVAIYSGYRTDELAEIEELSTRPDADVVLAS